MAPKIEMYKGDTLRLDVTLTNNGEPFVPTDEQVVFAVGHGHGSPPLFTSPVVEGVAQITHDQTKSLSAGSYCYDLRVYDADKKLVATPLFGEFVLLEVVNGEL